MTKIKLLSLAERVLNKEYDLNIKKLENQRDSIAENLENQDK